MNKPNRTIIHWNGLLVRTDNIPQPLPGWYKLTCLLTNKCYIGSATNVKRRLQNHSGKQRGNSPLLLDIQKYGSVHFLAEPLGYSIQSDDLLNMEIQYMHQFNTLYPNGYNQIEHVGSTIWITNGIQQRRIPKSQDIPEGWTIGRGLIGREIAKLAIATRNSQPYRQETIDKARRSASLNWEERRLKYGPNGRRK